MPQVEFCDSVQDCLDSLAWCRLHLPLILQVVDIDRYLVAGDSAGGTMSTVCGNLFRPRPKAVVDVFGIVDFTDKFFHVPHPPEHKYLRQHGKEELRRKLKDRDLTRAKVICPYDWELRALDGTMDVQQLQQLWGMPGYTPGEEEHIRMDMNKVLDEDGTRISTLLRKDAFSGDSEWQAEMKKWSAIHMVQAAGSYPPTFILHGTGDTIVPVEQSYRFSEKLKQLGVPVGEVYCPGGDHSFESEISVSDPDKLRKSPVADGTVLVQGREHPDWETYVVPCMDFVDRFVRG
jgi:acetyl esterase/lipase